MKTKKKARKARKFSKAVKRKHAATVLFRESKKASWIGPRLNSVSDAANYFDYLHGR